MKYLIIIFLLSLNCFAKVGVKTSLSISPSLTAIHRGDHFFLKTHTTIDGEGSIARFMFTTPAAREIHAKAILTANAGFTVEIWEGVTTSNNGNPVTTFNNNRILDTPPRLLSYSSPTVSDEGTLIWAGKLGDAKSPSGVSNSINYEIVAKKNTKYMFKITKDAASAHYVDVDFYWSEH